MDIDATNSPDLGAGLSTQIDTSEGATTPGGGIPRTLPQDEPMSLRDTITAVVKEEATQRTTDAKDTVAEDKADGKDAVVVDGGEKGDADKSDNEKPKAEDGDQNSKEGAEKPAKEDAKAADPKEEAKDREILKAKPAEKAEGEDNEDDDDWVTDRRGRRYRRYHAPEHFGPDAKEIWNSVPHAVKRDINIQARELEHLRNSTREVMERYEPIREFDELARQNGRDLAYSLERVKLIEDTLQTNPLAALELVLQEAGPRKANGQPLSLYEVAEFIVNQGRDQYQGMVAQGMPKQPHPAEIQAQQQQEQLMQLQARLVEMEVIAPFRESHPRYDELEGTIATILNSGMIPSNLSQAERLELAYAYAERLNPSSKDEPVSNTGSAPVSVRAVEDFGGNKSIKSSAGAVSDDMAVHDTGKSIRDTLREEMRKLRRA